MATWVPSPCCTSRAHDGSTLPFPYREMVRPDRHANVPSWSSTASPAKVMERRRQSVLRGNAALNPWDHTRVTNAISAAPSEDGLAIERLWWGC